MTEYHLLLADTINCHRNHIKKIEKPHPERNAAINSKKNIALSMSNTFSDI